MSWRARSQAESVATRGKSWATIQSMLWKLDGVIRMCRNHHLNRLSVRLWFGSNRGIFRLSKAELDRLAEGDASRLRPVVYGRAKGLANLECTGGFFPPGSRPATAGCGFPQSRVRKPLPLMREGMVAGAGFEPATFRL